MSYSPETEPTLSPAPPADQTTTPTDVAQMSRATNDKEPVVVDLSKDKHEEEDRLKKFKDTLQLYMLDTDHHGGHPKPDPNFWKNFYKQYNDLSDEQKQIVNAELHPKLEWLKDKSQDLGQWMKRQYNNACNPNYLHQSPYQASPTHSTSPDPDDRTQTESLLSPLDDNGRTKTEIAGGQPGQATAVRLGPLGTEQEQDQATAFRFGKAESLSSEQQKVVAEIRKLLGADEPAATRAAERTSLGDYGPTFARPPTSRTTAVTEDSKDSDAMPPLLPAGTATTPEEQSFTSRVTGDSRSHGSQITPDGLSTAAGQSQPKGPG
ncbi:MAG: hypothetical protein AAF153_00680, partial [Pseudomonadota bacterium]